jgi:hypothetical protein
MEPWFVTACAMNFGARIDQFIRDSSVEFGNLHPLSVAQSAGGFNKSFDNQDEVALPRNIALYEVPLHSWR